MIHAETIRCHLIHAVHPKVEGGCCLAPISACSVSCSVLSYNCRKKSREKERAAFCRREVIPDHHFHSKMRSCSDAWRPQTEVPCVRSRTSTLENSRSPRSLWPLLYEPKATQTGADCCSVLTAHLGKHLSPADCSFVSVVLADGGIKWGGEIAFPATFFFPVVKHFEILSPSPEHQNEQKWGGGL